MILSLLFLHARCEGARSQFFKDPQTGRTAAPVAGQFAGLGLDGLAGDQLCLCLAAADADREFGRTGAGGGPAAELVLHQPVLQGMEGDDAEPPAGLQSAENGVQALVQGVQLVVDRDAQGLKAAPGRVFVLAADRRRHGRRHQPRQLQRRLNGSLLPVNMFNLVMII